jgi:hypothetical protein
MLKRWFGLWCVGLLLVAGFGGIAEAYTAEVSYFFEGLDLDTGAVYRDPNILVVYQGQPQDITNMLKPPANLFTTFRPEVDVFVEWRPQHSFALAFAPSAADNPTRIVGLALLEGVPFDQAQDSTLFSNLAFSPALTSVDLEQADTLVLLTAAGTYHVIGNARADAMTAHFEVGDPVPASDAVPEPGTLGLLGIGLIGLLAMRGKLTKRSPLPKLLLLVGLATLFLAQPAAAQICDSVTEIPKTECQALEAIYNSTNGANWTNNTGWLQTTTPCTWFGVTCNAGHVTQIDLNSNKLTGTLPAEIAQLSNLYTLDLRGNQLTTLPAEIGQLSNLTTLDLSNNHLTALPAEFGQLSNLVWLDLRLNQLTTFPPEIGQLSNLSSLDVLDNPMHGVLPAELMKLHLNSFYFPGTGLCQPTDAEFQNWLGTISELWRNGLFCDGGRVLYRWTMV